MHRPRGRPQVVAHRGSSAAMAEHTLGAYVRALDDGADAVECDVRLTADGHLVCVHDRRGERAANGRGTVSTPELAHLEQLDWGSWVGTWGDVGQPQIPGPDAGPVLTPPPPLAPPPRPG